MFEKARHKLSFRSLALGAIAILLLGTYCQASVDILGGSLISATPFDKRVTSTGALDNDDFGPIVTGVRSSEELFIQARSIRYVPDDARDHWQTPQETRSRWAGDCEDKAVWLYAQLKQNGYPNVRLVVGRQRSVDKNFHVWVSMPDGQGGSLVLDPTAQKKIWNHKDFLEGQYKPLYSFDGIHRYRHDL